MAGTIAGVAGLALRGLALSGLALLALGQASPAFSQQPEEPALIVAEGDRVKEPHPRTVRKLAEALNTDPRELLADEG